MVLLTSPQPLPPASPAGPEVGREGRFQALLVNEASVAKEAESTEEA